MLEYMETINHNFINNGILQILPHKDIEKSVLKNWANTLKSCDTKSTIDIISTAFKRMKTKDFQTLMTLWTEDHNSSNVGYMVEYSDEYYGDLLFIGFSDFNSIVYYVWEV